MSSSQALSVSVTRSTVPVKDHHAFQKASSLTQWAIGKRLFTFVLHGLLLVKIGDNDRTFAHIIASITLSTTSLLVPGSAPRRTSAICVSTCFFRGCYCGPLVFLQSRLRYAHGNSTACAPRCTPSFGFGSSLKPMRYRCIAKCRSSRQKGAEHQTRKGE